MGKGFGRKIFDLLIGIFVFVFTLGTVLPTQGSVEYTGLNYMLGDVSYLSDEQIVYVGGENNAVWDEDGVSVSKTIDGTNVEDYFDITLQVKAKKTVTEYLEGEAVAVAIVIDLSNTMNAAVDGSSVSDYERSKAHAAAEAAGDFVTQFVANSSNYPNSVIGVVGFNTSGVEIAPMTNLTTNRVDNFNKDVAKKIKKTVQSYDSHPANRYTNIEAGLKMARTMLSGCTQKYQYVIFLGDGLPTTYTTSNSATNYTGTTVTTLKDGINNNANLIGGNYSDTGAVRARQVAMDLKNKGVTIYSIGVGLNTFDGTSNGNLFNGASIPFGSNSRNLNGEQFLMNQLGRSVLSTAYTVENTFPAITYLGNSNANRQRTWNNNKSTILNYDWEIRNNYNPDTMGTTPKYVLSETPPAGQPSLFENWLKYGIGSGHYFDVTNTQGLTDAINDIYSHLNSHALSRMATIWATTDPLSSIDEITGSLLEYVEFKGFFNSNNELVQSLSGTHGENNTNTARLDTTQITDGIIRWDLKNSGYSIEGDSTTSIYTYKLKYRVRLKTDKPGFISEKAYKTNGRTTLTYVIEENGVTSDEKTVDYPIPQVKGYLTEVKVKKTVEGLASGFQSFTTQNSNFEFTVELKRMNDAGEYVDLDDTYSFAYDKYDKDGNKYPGNLTISNGDTFTLMDKEYIVIHNLFHGISWKVTETAKNGFVSTIASGNSSGVTESSVPLSEVTFNNKAYQMKMKKIDGSSLEKLEGVRFSLYRTYENEAFSDVVTNMNGLLLQNLLTNDSGIINFGNLSFRTGGTTTYYLVEEETIDKYSMLDNYVEIKVNANGITAKYNDTNINVTQSGNVFEITVPNARGIDLPETGGVGSLFTMMGITCILLSSIGYAINKKKRNN